MIDLGMEVSLAAYGVRDASLLVLTDVHNLLDPNLCPRFSKSFSLVKVSHDVTTPSNLRPTTMVSSDVGAGDPTNTVPNPGSERGSTPPRPPSSLAEGGSGITTATESQGIPPLPLCNRCDNSDGNPGSPWSRKIVLALGR